MEYETIAVYGLGYIGLPTAATIASIGKKVIGIDVNRNVVDTVNSGKIHIVEPDLAQLVDRVVNDGLLVAKTTPVTADVYLIAVPTPFDDALEPNLEHIKDTIKVISQVLKKGDLIILESTSPVGTTEQLSEWLSELRPDLTLPSRHGENSDVRIAYCPERVLPGKVLVELTDNDRVIGGITPRCSEAALAFYKLFVLAECVTTDARTAEMCKLTENSFRDLNIAFANELSVLCEEQDINVWELIRLANRHPRVNILKPGCGVGGHCIAVDPYFIISQHPKDAQLISLARKVNEQKPQLVVKKIQEAAEKAKTVEVVIFGISFKPDIDDTRESPAVEIVEYLYSSGLSINVVEPNLRELPDLLSKPGINLFNSLEEIGGTKTAVYAILVSHREFIESAFELKSLGAIDFCGVYDGA